jgi:hypothetical protein
MFCPTTEFAISINKHPGKPQNENRAERIWRICVLQYGLQLSPHHGGGRVSVTLYIHTDTADRPRRLRCVQLS